ncbi:uncharacterized protein LOC128558083 [Mercenaria mercenaria]|uniref:uncharacterized protein LOC128558083 n=1 Tax=Mercenaria mercenaria TaxID=6596 RepID=UPI00234E6CBE|nr:uncharacterized protein LOC128558083 [Mercenaria mercenaria]
METLNPQQKLAMKMAIDGHNFTILGSAGTGKSSVVSAIADKLRNERENVALTCSTGIACLVPKHQHVIERIRQADVLILDECSMISKRTLESVAEVLALKDASVIISGIQVILCGDFRQLPPVKDISYGDDGSYCFEAAFFSSVIPHTVLLTDIVRQSDPALISAIREMSHGTVSVQTVNFIRSLSKMPAETSSYVAHLFAKNDLVDDFNRKNILDFPGQLYEFLAKDEGVDTTKLEKLTVPKRLWLKIGIPVILLRNLTDRLVNGLRGEIYDIDEDGPTVEFKDMGVTTKLARYTFEAGQLGVAMSRVRTAEGQAIINFNPKYCIGHSCTVSSFLEKESAEVFEDCRCCKNCKRNVPEAVVNVAQECVATDVDIMLDDTEEDEFDKEFDQVLLKMDSYDRDIHSFSVPEDFSVKSVLESIKITKAVTTSQIFINSVLTDLPLERMTMGKQYGFVLCVEMRMMASST